MDKETIYMILAIILLIIGIAVALFGRAIWDSVMSIIGGMIGWMLGFGIGVLLFGYDSWTEIIIAIILGFVGSLIMGAIFGALVEAALSLLAGILVGVLVYFATDENLMYAAITCIVVAILSFVLMEHIIAFITAFIGAVLAGAAIWYLMDLSYAILGFILLFVFGSLIQHFMLDDNDTGR
jgi:hypothetical protein